MTRIPHNDSGGNGAAAATTPTPTRWGFPTLPGHAAGAEGRWCFGPVSAARPAGAPVVAGCPGHCRGCGADLVWGHNLRPVDSGARWWLMGWPASWTAEQREVWFAAWEHRRASRGGARRLGRRCGSRSRAPRPTRAKNGLLNFQQGLNEKPSDSAI